MRRHRPAAWRLLFVGVALAVLMGTIGLRLFLEPVKAAEGGLTYLEPYPRGAVMVRQPEIGWPVRVHGASVRQATLYLSGKSRSVRVNLGYDAAKGAYVYHPPELLPPGEYEARIRLEFQGLYQPVEQHWTFQINRDAVSLRHIMERVETPVQQAALKAANDYRDRLGLPPFQVHPSLMLAAEEHAAYLEENGTLSHYQEPGKPRFTGRTVEERAQRAGYFLGVAEDISQQPEEDPVVAVDGLFDAPYHRIPFMYPHAWEWGYGQKGLFHVINVGIVPMEKVRVVHYPVDGEKGVPMQWKGNEIPDPLRLHADVTLPVGYPLVIGAFGDPVKEVRLFHAVLTDEEGREQALYINTPATDEHLKQELILIPVKPLKPDVQYQVQVDWGVVRNDGTEQTLHTAWSFQTERRPGEGKQQLHALVLETQVEGTGADEDQRQEMETERAEQITHVTFWSDLPLLKRWSRSFKLPFSLSQERLAGWMGWLDDHLGFQWQAEDGRLTWRVGDYELEWLFYEQQDSQTKG